MCSLAVFIVLELNAVAPSLVGVTLDDVAPGASQPGREPPSLEEIGELFRLGQVRFETSDFVGAIELWTRAYEGLPDDSSLLETRAMLMANIAQAHVEAHSIDGEIEHLRRADLLFEQYLDTLDPEDAETRAAIGAQRASIAETIAAHDRADAAAREARAREAKAAMRARERDAARADRARTDRRPAPRADRYSRSERAMVIGGGVAIAFGVGTVGALGAFLWLRDEEERDGARAARDPTTPTSELLRNRAQARRFNRLAISTGAAAAVLTVIGAGVITAAEVHGARRRRATVSAFWTPDSIGVGARGWF